WPRRPRRWPGSRRATGRPGGPRRTAGAGSGNRCWRPSCDPSRRYGRRVGCSPGSTRPRRCGWPASRWYRSGATDWRTSPARARRAALADVPAPVLYGDLVGLDALPSGFARELRDFEWDHATLKVDWALSAPIPWTAPDARRAGTVHLGGDLDGLSRYAADLR